MSAWRDAVALPALFLTVLLLGGLRLDSNRIVAPPTLFSLVLAMLLCAALVQSGTLAPDRLMSARRSALANLNGLIVLLSLFAATAQALSLVIPTSGLPAVVAGIVLLVMLIQLLATSLDRTRLLRGLMVTLGAGFTLKFIVLTALSSPAEGRVTRALQLLFENVTLGAIAQPPLSTAYGYLAFATLALYLVALWLLPEASWRTERIEGILVVPDDERSVTDQWERTSQPPR
jgi:hypothetical protein